MRCFIGISLESTALSRVVKLQEGLAKNGYKGNFTGKTNIHITLSFLGEQNERDVNKIIEIMDGIDFKEFIVKINKMTNLKDMIILEISKDKELMELQKTLTNKLKENGFKVDEKEYYPHITLIRENNIKTNIDLDINSKVDRIILFESRRNNSNGKSYLEYRRIFERVSK